MRFGVATCDITPPFPTLMHGYGARRDFYDGVNDPVTFTAVVIEEGDRRMLLGAADLCSFPTDGSIGGLLAEAGERAGCPPDRVMLNASHTHGGPMTPNPHLFFRYLEDAGSTARYGEFLREKVLETVIAARDGMMEGSLWYGEGRTSLPMNRRALVAGKIENAPNPDGPTDDRLQVLAFKDASQMIRAVAARVACHPVTTGAQHLLTADYPGAWRDAVRRAFGGVAVPIFLQGAGADARPRHAREGDRWAYRPHGMLPEIGWELCAETLAVLTGRPLTPVGELILEGERRIVTAPCEQRFTTRADFERIMKDGGHYEKLYAEEALRRLDGGREVPDHVEFQVQTLWLGRDLALIGLDVEPLLALGFAVERAVDPAKAVLLGYTNGCVGYAPDSVEMARGGYETTSYLHNCWTGPLKPGLERLFADAVLPRPRSAGTGSG